MTNETETVKEEEKTVLEKIIDTNGEKIKFSFMGTKYPLRYRRELYVMIASGSSRITASMVAAAFPDDWDWNWIAIQGAYRGKLTTRINKLIRSELRFKMSSARIDRIGDTLQKNMNSAKNYIFDFTQELNWIDGDFGDEGSCFWGGGPTRAYMRANDFWAIRFYRKNGRGFARAWVLPITEIDSLVITNCYGHRSYVIADVLVGWLELDRHNEININQTSTNKRRLYCNGDARIIIGPNSTTPPFVTLNMQKHPSDEILLDVGRTNRTVWIENL